GIAHRRATGRPRYRPRRVLRLVQHPAEADAEHERRGEAQAPANERTAPTEERRLRPPLPARFPTERPYLFPRRLRHVRHLLEQLVQKFRELLAVLSHVAHFPANSASASRSFARALDSRAFEVPVVISRTRPISSCV